MSWRKDKDEALQLVDIVQREHMHREHGRKPISDAALEDLSIERADRCEQCRDYCATNGLPFAQAGGRL